MNKFQSDYKEKRGHVASDYYSCDQEISVQYNVDFTDLFLRYHTYNNNLLVKYIYYEVILQFGNVLLLNKSQLQLVTYPKIEIFCSSHSFRL